ncbi:adenylate/guanylate cyclase domain-containing protein [Streptomyces sp. NPDC087440]|uniref:adenylate/guanylate cyclase domain-containing protein n=1 Tax=Streptomyces sp. NPDC087440 TaxID=3365790 RepID=UPI003805A72A
MTDTVPQASANTVPHASADSVPHASADTGPQASADSDPHASADTGPRASADTAPHASADTTPHASRDSSPTTPAAALEAFLLGGARRYTRAEVAALAEVPQERVHRLWRALGFAAAGDDEVVFTDADVAAARTAYGLLESGLIDPSLDAAVTRALGHHLSRLAEWQIEMVRDWLAGTDGSSDSGDVVGLAEVLLPALEQLQGYVWRRHLTAHAGRVLSLDGMAGRETRHTAVGFVDMVGYTRLTRRLGEHALVAVLEKFESVAADAVSEHGGRVVKTIGDEVLFTVDCPAAAAEIALVLLERAEADPDMPELRTGLAHGQVLGRLGDVYGEVVNIAARLTAVARPGTIVADQQLADGLRDQPDYHVRSLRPVSVRGYSKLRAYAIRRGRPPKKS